MEATQEITVIELFVTRQKAKQKAHPASQCKLRMMLMPWNTLNVIIVNCYLYWNDYSYDEIRWGTIYSDWNGKGSRTNLIWERDILCATAVWEQKLESIRCWHLAEERWSGQEPAVLVI